MAKTRQQKEKAVKDLHENLSKMKSLVFADFTHLSVAEMEDLRVKLREQGATLKVVKKSLFNIAWREVKTLKKHADVLKIERPLSVAFGFEDEVTPAKILFAFKKEHKKFEILGGISGGNYLSPEEIASLAKLPGQEALRGQVVYMIKSPITGLVNVLAGNIRNLIYVLKNLSAKSAA